MIDTAIANALKSSCFGLGLRENDSSDPFLISGTGFFIDSDGFFATAAHVVEGLLSEIKKLKNQFPDISLAAMWIVNDENGMKPVTHSIHATLNLKLVETRNYYGKERFDICVGRIQGKFGSLPFLKIKGLEQHKLYSDILMCGYPGGSQTLHTFSKKTGLKTSPILQRGIISSIIPNDNTSKPAGIITDIIGTGGSSGSPIVDANDGEVVGIAQQVVGADTQLRLINNNTQHDLFGTAKVGVTFGVSNFMLYPTVTAGKARLSQSVDSNGNFIGSSGETTETVKIDMKGNKIE